MIKNYKKRSVVLGTSAGTIQENSGAEDRPGTNFSGEKSKENAPVRADLRDTNGGGELFTNLAFAVLVVVATVLFVVIVSVSRLSHRVMHAWTVCSTAKNGAAMIPNCFLFSFNVKKQYLKRSSINVSILSSSRFHSHFHILVRIFCYV